TTHRPLAQSVPLSIQKLYRRAPLQASVEQAGQTMSWNRPIICACEISAAADRRANRESQPYNERASTVGRNEGCRASKDDQEASERPGR
ncbi:hypothetical protein BC938DRAFT_479193, partial [Jimgerdemannia flammicorona]